MSSIEVGYEIQGIGRASSTPCSSPALGPLAPSPSPSAAPSLAGGIGTRAVLVQGADRLLDVELRDEERTFEVDVPAAGQLLLAFVNDYYDPPEDRNLWVSGLEFTPRAP
jgi:hypothetical protein